MVWIYSFQLYEDTNMILTYATFLNEKDKDIKKAINTFISNHQYTEVSSFKANELTLRKFINRGGEIVLQDGPTQVRVEFDYKHDKLIITINHTVKAFVEVFTNSNPLVSMIGHVIKEHDVSLCSFDLGSDGVIHTY